MVNDMRPIVWVEKQEAGCILSITVHTHFGCLQKPMLNASQIILPLQAQQLGRSYTGRLLVDVVITVKQTVNGEVVQQFTTDIKDVCVGEIPVLVGSAVCHRVLPGAASCFFIVNGQSKVLVSQEQGVMYGGWVGRTGRPAPERLINNHPLINVQTLQSRQTQYSCEVRSVPCNNPYRYPVVFTVRVTQTVESPYCPPRCTGDRPVLRDPIVVTLTYFRHDQG